jgi:hypothetical protein
MSQRNVELLIGRLLTDEEMRRQFMRKPGSALEDFCRQGWELSQGEIEALAGTDATMWSELASRIPSRLQRCSLKTY